MGCVFAIRLLIINRNTLSILPINNKPYANNKIPCKVCPCAIKITLAGMHNVGAPTTGKKEIKAPITHYFGGL